MRRIPMVHGIASLMLIFLFVSCASDSSYKYTVTSLNPGDPIYEATVAKVLELVAHLGGTVEDPRTLKKVIVNKTISYRCESMASISNNSPVLYKFDLNEDLKIDAFQPKDFFLHGIQAGMGADLLKDKTIREELITAVTDFNRYFRIKYYDGPFVQTFADSCYLVTFHSESKENIQKILSKNNRWRHVIFEPYVSFLLTKDMKVFGVFWGA